MMKGFFTISPMEGPVPPGPQVERGCPGLRTAWKPSLQGATNNIGCHSWSRLRRVREDLDSCRSLSEKRSCRTCSWSPTGSCVRSSRGGKVSRRQARVEMVKGDEKREAHLLVTASPFVYGDTKLVLLTLEDVSEMFHLRSLIPICASCKKIRNDEDYWENVEVYLNSRIDVDFTHSICPECVEELYPDLVGN